MNNAQVITPSYLAAALKKVPEKKFRIADLSWQLINDKGKVDIEKVMEQQGELNLAIAEVKGYIERVKDLSGKFEYLKRNNSRVLPLYEEDLEDADL
jgi:hypothetical protein